MKSIAFVVILIAAQPKEMPIRTILVTSEAEANELKGVRVSGEVIVLKIEPDVVRAAENTPKIAGKYHMRAHRGGWYRVDVNLPVGDTGLMEGDIVTLAGDVASVTFADQQDFINGKVSGDRLVTLDLSNVEIKNISRPQAATAAPVAAAPPAPRSAARPQPYSSATVFGIAAVLGGLLLIIAALWIRAKRSRDGA